jgi:hypothetical protein
VDAEEEGVINEEDEEEPYFSILLFLSLRCF